MSKKLVAGAGVAALLVGFVAPAALAAEPGEEFAKCALAIETEVQAEAQKKLDALGEEPDHSAPEYAGWKAAVDAAVAESEAKQQERIKFECATQSQDDREKAEAEALNSQPLGIGKLEDLSKLTDAQVSDIVNALNDADPNNDDQALVKLGMKDLKDGKMGPLVGLPADHEGVAHANRLVRDVYTAEAARKLYCKVTGAGTDFPRIENADKCLEAQQRVVEAKQAVVDYGNKRIAENNAKKDESKKDDAKKDESKKDDAKKDESKKDDAKKADAKKADAKAADAKKGGLAKTGATVGILGGIAAAAAAAGAVAFAIRKRA